MIEERPASPEPPPRARLDVAVSHLSGVSPAAGRFGRGWLLLVAGGIVASGWVGGACGSPAGWAARTTANPETGTLQVTVTGLPALLSGGGSAVAQRTDSAGAPITIDVSAAGIGFSSSVPAGIYSVTYTPPSGCSVSGSNPVTGTVVSSGGTATAVFSVTVIVGTGAIQVTVTGLTGTPANGGTAVAQRTDSAGTPITIAVSRAGSGANSAVPAGTYTVTYTPPSGFTVSGTSAVTGIVVAAGGTGAAAFSVAAIAGTGTLQVAVTGLTGPLANGGSAVAQRTDSAGAPITINISAAGLGSVTSVPTGTYSVTYSPPSGWSVGGSNPLTGRVVTAGGTTTATFVAVVTGSYLPPNLLSNESFETGWDNWTDASGGSPTATRDNTMPPAPGGGSWAVRASVANAYYFRRELPGGPYDEVWFRAYVRFSAGYSVTSQGSFWKFWRYRTAPNNQVGGGFDMTGSGLEFGSYQECASHFAMVFSNAMITPDTWHILEWHYKRNGDALPWAEFWWDNALVTHADGPAAYNGCLTWSGNRLYMGWPNARGTYVQLRSVDMVGTADNVSGTGTVWIDRIAGSTLGRIGP